MTVLLLLIPIQYNTQFLNHIYSTNLIGYYLLLIFTFSSILMKHLRGTTYRKNNKMPEKLFIVLNKLSFIGFIYSLFYNDYLNYLFLIYISIYFNFQEFNGEGKISMIYLGELFNIFKYFGDYHIINKYEPLVEGGQYLLGVHPHGLFPLGSLGSCGLPSDWNLINRYIPIFTTQDIFIGQASFCFYIPFLRELFIGVGGVDCSKPILDSLMKKGKSIGIFIGGAQEAEYSGVKRTTLIIKERKGFFKLALEHGYTVIPVYTFGQNNVFESIDFDFNDFFKTIKLILGIWVPRGKINLKKQRFITCFGKPIKVEKNRNYTNEDVDKLQEEYIKRLNELFDSYKSMDSTCMFKKLDII